MAIAGFPAWIHYPLGDEVEVVSLTEKPEKGKTVSLRASLWLIADVQHAARPEDADEPILWDVWVQSVEKHD